MSILYTYDENSSVLRSYITIALYAVAMKQFLA